MPLRRNELACRSAVRDDRSQLRVQECMSIGTKNPVEKIAQKRLKQRRFKKSMETRIEK
jgi:hypothetical protein